MLLLVLFNYTGEDGVGRGGGVEGKGKVHSNLISLMKSDVTEQN